MGKRTVKQGLIRSKSLKARKEKTQSAWPYKKYRKLSFDEARELGVIEPRKFVRQDGMITLDTNPANLSQHDYFFRKRRKLNWVTRKKFGINGKDYFWNDLWSARGWLVKHKNQVSS